MTRYSYLASPNFVIERGTDPQWDFGQDRIRMKRMWIRNPAVGVLFLLLCPGCPIMDLLSCPSPRPCSDCPLFAVFGWLSCSSFPVWAVLACSGCSILVFLFWLFWFWLSCSGRSCLALLFLLHLLTYFPILGWLCSGCPPLAGLSKFSRWPSYSICSVLVVLFMLSFSIAVAVLPVLPLPFLLFSLSFFHCPGPPVYRAVAQFYYQWPLGHWHEIFSCWLITKVMCWLRLWNCRYLGIRMRISVVAYMPVTVLLLVPFIIIDELSQLGHGEIVILFKVTVLLHHNFNRQSLNGHCPTVQYLIKFNIYSLKCNFSTCVLSQSLFSTILLLASCLNNHSLDKNCSYYSMLLIASSCEYYI